MSELLQILLKVFINQLKLTNNSMPRNIVFLNEDNFIKIIVGVRGCGKTYCFFQHIHYLLSKRINITQILYINLEDERILPIHEQQLSELLESFYIMYPDNNHRTCYIFLDGINSVLNWQNAINRLIDNHKNVQIFLSCSSIRFFKKKVTDLLKSKVIIIEIWPYNFREYCLFNNIDISGEITNSNESLIFLKKALLDYFNIGGFPAAQRLNDMERRAILKNSFDTIIFRDIVEECAVTNSVLLKHLIKELIINITKPFSVNKLYNNLKRKSYKVGKDTLYNYLHYLEDAYLIFMVPIFNEYLRKGQKKPRKIYTVDSSLILANTFNGIEDSYCILENLIYLELRRKCYTVYYYITSSGLEIDFLIEKDGYKELLQVIYDYNDVKNLNKKQTSLEEAKKETGFPGKIIDIQAYLETYTL